MSDKSQRKAVALMRYLQQSDFRHGIIKGHMYRTNFGIGHSIKDLLDAHVPPGGRLGRGHKGLYDTINNSINLLHQNSKDSARLNRI